jgi:hypothetical protein
VAVVVHAVGVRRITFVAHASTSPPVIFVPLEDDALVDAQGDAASCPNVRTHTTTMFAHPTAHTQQQCVHTQRRKRNEGIIQNCFTEMPLTVVAEPNVVFFSLKVTIV